MSKTRAKADLKTRLARELKRYGITVNRCPIEGRWDVREGNNPRYYGTRGKDEETALLAAVRTLLMERSKLRREVNIIAKAAGRAVFH